MTHFTIRKPRRSAVALNPDLITPKEIETHETDLRILARQIMASAFNSADWYWDGDDVTSAWHTTIEGGPDTLVFTMPNGDDRVVNERDIITALVRIARGLTAATDQMKYTVERQLETANFARYSLQCYSDMTVQVALFGDIRHQWVKGRRP